MYNKKTKPKPNDGEHIKDIISRTVCRKHKADKGEPCFNIKFDSRAAYGAGICNDRVVKAGYNGTISDSAMSKSSGPRRDGKKPPRRYGSASPISS